MDLLSIFQITLPLTNPVLIFAIILFIILFAPIVLEKFSIPPLVGLILAGILIGEYGFNLIVRDSSIVLFGTVGLLYIMFLVGLEIDLAEFRKNSTKSLIFGLYSFLFPMITGTLMGYYFLGFPLRSSLLLASLFASHTLVTYPIVSKFGVVKNQAVTVAVGGTLIADTLALLVLAVIAGISAGETSGHFFLRMSISVTLFVLFVIFVFPLVANWFFKNYHDGISHFIFILALVFMASFLAQLAGIEPIIGAFLAGLTLNRFVPTTSPLMNRIEFVGNALFIPFFLIGVGMLIDYNSFMRDTTTIIVAIAMSVIALFSKFIAAWLAQKTFRFSSVERNIIFGLTNSRAAGSLAVILVGYNIIIGETGDGMPIRLLNESVLNGTILMILVTCTVSSFVTQKAARMLASAEDSIGAVPFDGSEEKERFLIPLANIENVEELVHLGVTLKSSAKGDLYGLHILNGSEDNPAKEKKAARIIEKAQKAAASTENRIVPLIRYDINVVNGISNVIKENKITDIILGLHEKKGIIDTYLGNLTKGLLTNTFFTTIIYRSMQPLSTIRRFLIFVPDNAIREIGFPFWLVKVWNIGRNTGAGLLFFGSGEIIRFLKSIHLKHPAKADFREFTDWENFHVLAEEVRRDDTIIFIMSRKNYVSYHPMMAQVPVLLNRYFTENSFLLVFPKQGGIAEFEKFNPANPSLLGSLEDRMEKMDELVKTVGHLIKRK